MPSTPAPGARLLRLWRTLSPLPGGKWIYSRLLGFSVPYTGSVRPGVEELRPGYARVSMRDRRAVRNHLHSIHAIALANLAEVTSGLAMIVALPENSRSIVTAFSIEYLKKARGRLSAECTAPPVDASVEGEHSIQSLVYDSTGDVVARATARWLVGPREDRSESDTLQRAPEWSRSDAATRSGGNGNSNSNSNSNSTSGKAGGA